MSCNQASSCVKTIPNKIPNRAEDESNSGLTETGKTQVQLLSQYFRDRLIRFTQVFSSDLDRATDTAEGICANQLGAGRLVPIQTPALREQQFTSSLEGTRWQSGAAASSISSPDGLAGGEPGYTQEEPLSAMKARVHSFLRENILPLLSSSTQEEIVAVVAHGVILQVVWVCLADLFEPGDIHFGPGLSQADFEDKVAPIWSNTGVMELDISPRAPGRVTQSVPGAGAAAPGPVLTGSAQLPNRGTTTTTASSSALTGWSMTILTIDSTAHLATTQIGRTGGTVRNAVHGSRQQPMDEFFRITGTA